MLTRIFGPKRHEITEDRRKSDMRSAIISTPQQILLELSYNEE
jgi:hypothetical protein